MKIKFLTIVLSLLAFQSVMAQQTEIKEANPADVASIDQIMRAVYEVISGDAGQKRDWDRFRSLFHKDARMIPSGKNPTTGVLGARALSPEDYVKRNESFFEKEGFHEREIARRTDVYGNIAQVFQLTPLIKKPTTNSRLCAASTVFSF